MDPSNPPAEAPTTMDNDDLYGDAPPNNKKTEPPPIPTTTLPPMLQPSPGGIPGLFLLSDPSSAERMDTDIVVPENATGTPEPGKYMGFSRDDFRFALAGGESPIATETQSTETQSPETTSPEATSPEATSPETRSPEPMDDTPAHFTTPKNIPAETAIETTADTSMNGTPKDPHPDAAFPPASLANNLTPAPEWELDSSASDSTDSSEAEAEADSDGYDLLDPQSLAKLLMDENDSDTDRHIPSQGPLKTKNEIPDEALPIPRPNITLTPATLITHLGTIQSIIGTMVLIKASTPGDHKVLNESSLLCLTDRSILGVVADTFGRVEEPLYTVRFNTPEEILGTGATVDAAVYYVPEHSNYVFTAALKQAKGSDASNIFDEEIADAEQEFSDDEKEADAKRVKKGSKRRGPPGVHVHETDEPYVPLARPANLQEMLSTPPPLRGRGRNDRGRVRGRGGRGGRGGGGWDERDGRRGRDNRGAEFRRNNHESQPENYNPYPTENYNPQPYPQLHSHPHQFNQYPLPLPLPLPPPPQQWAPPPSLQQFHGFPSHQYPQYPQQQQRQQQQQQQNFFPGTLPQGAHVNPAFFGGQQSWTPQVQQDSDALKALQNLLSLSKAAQEQGGQGGV